MSTPGSTITTLPGGGITQTFSFSFPLRPPSQSNAPSEANAQPDQPGQAAPTGGAPQLPPLISQLFGTAFGIPITQVIPENGNNAMGLLHNLLGLPGNSGDYAFGRQMDDIISRLMDEGAMYVDSPRC